MNSEVTKLPKRRISELKPHPKNAEIYGLETVTDLVKEIEASGYISPLMITHDNIIVSGNRRHRACVELGIDEVEVIVRRFENEFDILEALVRENDVREKTNLQKANEAAVLLLVEGEKAKLRKSLGGKGGIRQDGAVPPYLGEIAKMGRARDAVAEQVGFKSGREVERAMRVVQAIKQAEMLGDTEKAEILKGQLERSPATAEGLARNWDTIDKEKLEEQKDELKNGKKSAFGLLLVNPDNHNPFETKRCNICGEEKTLSEFRNDCKNYRNSCKSCMNKKHRMSTDKDTVEQVPASQAPDFAQKESEKLGRYSFIMGGIGTLTNAVKQVRDDLEKYLTDVHKKSERNDLKQKLEREVKEISKLIELIG